MRSSPADPSAALTAAVQEYHLQGDVGTLLDRVQALSRAADPDALLAAAAPYRDLPEVVIPVYERVVAVRTQDAQAMVVLANAYWLTGRGADVVDQLARAALADNAASVAGAEHDPLALDLAVRTYEGLWAEASRDEERRALEETITKLKGWAL